MSHPDARLLAAASYLDVVALACQRGLDEPAVSHVSRHADDDADLTRLGVLGVFTLDVAHGQRVDDAGDGAEQGIVTHDAEW